MRVRRAVLETPFHLSDVGLHILRKYSLDAVYSWLQALKGHIAACMHLKWYLEGTVYELCLHR